MPRRWLPALTSLLALAAMLAAPLSLLLCCRVLGEDLRHHAHRDGHGHPHHGGQVARTAAEHQPRGAPRSPAVTRPAPGACPLVSLPPAELPRDQAAAGGHCAACRANTAAGTVAASPASLAPPRRLRSHVALAARGPPRPGGPIYLRTCSLLI